MSEQEKYLTETRERLLREIEERKLDVQAIDRLLALVQREQQSTSSPLFDAGQPTGREVNLADVIRRTVQDLDKFTIVELEKHLRRLNPAVGERIKRAYLSSFLHRLVKNNTIRVESSGAGRRPTLYRTVAGGAK